jgi:hypothetical protein
MYVWGERDNNIGITACGNKNKAPAFYIIDRSVKNWIYTYISREREKKI